MGQVCSRASASVPRAVHGSSDALARPNLFSCRPPGFHWLTASFWLVSQQPDICTGPWCWRAFNGILGFVHVFLFLNVKDGPSRFRMASFYTVRFDFHVKARARLCSCHPTYTCLQTPDSATFSPPPLQFMLVENATLLLAASDFLSEASWDSMTLPITVLCSFLLGESPSLSKLFQEQICLRCFYGQHS